MIPANSTRFLFFLKVLFIDVFLPPFPSQSICNMDMSECKMRTPHTHLRTQSTKVRKKKKTTQVYMFTSLYFFCHSTCNETEVIFLINEFWWRQYANTETKVKKFSQTILAMAKQGGNNTKAVHSLMHPILISITLSDKQLQSTFAFLIKTKENNGKKILCVEEVDNELLMGLLDI